ncbi:MAG: RNA polymerase sigma factor [Chitinophagaceae bacterium]
MSILLNLEDTSFGWDEAMLLEACRQNNLSAQKAFYQHFSPSMLGVCYRYVKNLQDAEDILQEGFIKVFSHLGQYQARGSLEGWIKRIMVNTALNHLKKNKEFRQSLNLERIPGLSGSPEGEEVLFTKDLIELIRSLPTGYRTVFNLYAIEGFSHQEIGKMLGISENTSRSQYSRAKTMLVKLIPGNPEKKGLKIGKP